jgi:hypothetical protein
MKTQPFTIGFFNKNILIKKNQPANEKLFALQKINNLLKHLLKYKHGYNHQR